MKKALTILTMLLVAASAAASPETDAVFEFPAKMLDHSHEHFRMKCSELEGEFVHEDGDNDRLCVLGPMALAGTWENGLPTRTGLIFIGDKDALQSAFALSVEAFGEPHSVEPGVVKWTKHPRAIIVATVDPDKGVLVYSYFPKGERL